MGHLERFMDQYDKSLDTMTTEDARGYLLNLLQMNLSHSYVNQAMSALRFWFGEVERHSDFPKQWTGLKREKKLPSVLSGNVVLHLLESITNIKHRLILTLIYSAGLRISEAARLKVHDVDAGRHTIHIRQAKGRKDRYTVLSQAANELLRQYSPRATRELAVPRRNGSEPADYHKNDSARI